MMPLFKKILLIFTSWGVMFCHIAFADESTGAEMDFHGSLVAQPCWVNPDNAGHVVDMGDIPSSDLYSKPQSKNINFTIVLSGCDFGGAGKGTVTTRFEGSESPELPGYLAMSTANTGAAIGFMTQKGEKLALGDESAPVEISNGGNILNFIAYVQGEPTAIADRTIAIGDFTATTTFFLDYP